MNRSRAATVAATVLPLALVLSACSQAPDDSAASEPQGESVEQRSTTPRLALTYDGGVMVLDGASLEMVDEFERDGYLRLNPMGDGRHVSVTTPSGFEALDLGTWAEPHGDHSHFYTGPAGFPGTAVEAGKGGHVVVHDGRTVFFDDDTGEMTSVDSADVANPDAEHDVSTTDEPHHGVAVELSDGTLVYTLGDEESRTGLVAVDQSGAEIARTEECPGVHGESAADGALSFGCEDGTVLFSGGGFHKVDAPDEYGRLGNQSGTPESHVVLADYKVDEDAELERPTRVALVDTRDRSMQLVELPGSYSFRSLERGPRGEALVLTTDGALQVIDPETGEITRSVDVVEPWEEPVQWQEPRPAVRTLGNTVYVTEPASNRVHTIDALDWEIGSSAELPHTPDEIAGVTGDAAE